MATFTPRRCATDGRQYTSPVSAPPECRKNDSDPPRRRDPQYGPVLALAAVCCHRLCLDGLSNDPEMHHRRGADFARQDCGSRSGFSSPIMRPKIPLDLDAKMA